MSWQCTACTTTYIYIESKAACISFHKYKSAFLGWHAHSSCGPLAQPCWEAPTGRCHKGRFLSEISFYVQLDSYRLDIPSRNHGKLYPFRNGCALSNGGC